MIDLKDLRENPDRYRKGAAAKGFAVDIDTLLALDEQIRSIQARLDEQRAEQNRLGKEIGPQIGRLKGRLKQAADAERADVERELESLQERPVELKNAIQHLESELARLSPGRDDLLLQIPLPPDPDVPPGGGPEDNIEIRRWQPEWFDPSMSFEANRGFRPRTHMNLMLSARLIDFERAVKMAGTRHYVMCGDGMRLYQAILRYAFDFIINRHGFTPMSVPVIVREECMVGTGFFPAGREQAYHIEETSRGSGHDLFLTGTGEVGLMGLHADEILDGNSLPLKYATVSTCFRREAGAAGKDTAGLYRVHQFDKVEQVVICRNDVEESRRWHRAMIDIVEQLLQSLQLPYRLLQCCAGDLGPKNADMVDIECWMPGRGEDDATGAPLGEYGETHSASRLYDFQCRRLKLRYRDEDGRTVYCHSLNNTVIACPRILIPIAEMYQNEDGSITVPEVLRPYMNGCERIG